MAENSSNARDAAIGLYERHARAFDRDRSRSLQERAWLDRFLGYVPPGGTVLDVGCGMGEPIASLSPKEYEQRLVSNGFVVRAYVPDDSTCGQHTVWLATYDGKSAV